MLNSFVNISFYKFHSIEAEKLVPLRELLREFCPKQDLKGTILLSREGINGFLAGTRTAIEAFKALPEISAFGELPYKESFSDHQPFRRMLVKIKKEIITMGCPEIEPAKFTGKRVKALELKQWLDEGREIVVLDTRNDYEVRVGAFESAVDMGLKTFRQFPAKVKGLGPDLKKKTVVTYCTGGIRCEKATAYLMNEGFEDVYQLDGGILRYFEEAGGSHYRGECFVFDYRVGVDPQLAETGTVLCYNCQNPVTTEEQSSPLYVPEQSCPHCAGKPKEHKERIAMELAGAEQ